MTSDGGDGGRAEPSSRPHRNEGFRQTQRRAGISCWPAGTYQIAGPTSCTGRGWKSARRGRGGERQATKPTTLREEMSCIILSLKPPRYIGGPEIVPSQWWRTLTGGEAVHHSEWSRRDLTPNGRGECAVSDSVMCHPEEDGGDEQVAQEPGAGIDLLWR
ncbi:hypothetical protein K431DRAFT_143272 [Polychaeton citri CBS 116435]|uniref:Uncharacterized protein n=1 Tax=Polychaeton citri CBS 116435 TaxID=1314669 RepID=A0A9P4Q4K6_9PEZI|nr:hypothetical protein K431DRAFT_143272 [Polychaeton citri CBS 116435]